MLSESQLIGRKHASSSAIQEALNPVKGIRDEISRKGGTPKNHARENLIHLKKVQKVIKEKQQKVEIEKEKQGYIPVNPKYCHIPSRLYLKSEKLVNDNDSAQSGNFDKSSTTSRRLSSSEENLKSNFLSASAGGICHLSTRKTKLGQVPKYLIRRKEEWAHSEEKKRQKVIEEATWPPGTVPVPENERITTLNQLKKVQKTLLEELSKFPVTLQPSHFRKYQRKKEVEAKLAEVDRDIEVYSQSCVFMAKP